MPSEDTPLVVASNRGPVTFEKVEGKFVPRKGAGGLVTALTHVMRHIPGVWVASALTSGDREMSRLQQERVIDVPLDGGEIRVRYLGFERDVFDRYYNRISNWVFWFLLHGLWNLQAQPRFDSKTRDAWSAYQAVDQRFAEAIAEEVWTFGGSSPVMLHDYHLMLAGAYLQKFSPDTFTYHFMHCPWPHPDGMSILPRDIAVEVLESLLANDLLGFQTERWARNFVHCCEAILHAEVDYERLAVRQRGREVPVRHFPISIDVDAVRSQAHSPEATEHLSWLDRSVGDRKLVIRVDRMELSKNVVRGFLAYEEFLHMYPEWRGNVVHLALLYPSRRALAEYRAYEAEVMSTYDRINTDLGTDDWQPIILFNEDNYTRALACLRRYDVLLVNPIIDGMNLVAKEGPAVNENNGVLVLSRNAGAWEELGHGALGVNPFDIVEMAETIQAALTMDEESRASRLAVLREVVERNGPQKWMSHQLETIRLLR